MRHELETLKTLERKLNDCFYEFGSYPLSDMAVKLSLNAPDKFMDLLALRDGSLRLLRLDLEDLIDDLSTRKINQEQLLKRLVMMYTNTLVTSLAGFDQPLKDKLDEFNFKAPNKFTNVVSTTDLIMNNTSKELEMLITELDGMIHP